MYRGKSFCLDWLKVISLNSRKVKLLVWCSGFAQERRQNQVSSEVFSHIALSFDVLSFNFFFFFLLIISLIVFRSKENGKHYRRVPFNLTKPSFHEAPDQNFTFLFEWKESATEDSHTELRRWEDFTLRHIWPYISVVSLKLSRQ